MAQADETLTPSISAAQLADPQAWMEMERRKIDGFIALARELKASGQLRTDWDRTALLEWLGAWRFCRRQLRAGKDIEEAQEKAEQANIAILSSHALSSVNDESRPETSQLSRSS